MSSPIHLETRADCSAWVAAYRQQQQKIALVPTMGNLHAGHISLVEEAHKHADRVIASIYVNPTQFGPKEDFATYPRTLNADSAKLTDAGCHAIFIPTQDQLYPLGTDDMRIIPTRLEHELCGGSRPGFFAGICTVVMKLFQAVQPDVAVFGEKDRQQLLIIQHMVQEFFLPIKIIGCPIVREDDGLAMSSRNGYLSVEERAKAPLLFQQLNALVNACSSGETNYRKLETKVAETLASEGFVPDYISLRDKHTLQVIEDGAALPATATAVFGAAALGKARLIDNIAFGDTS